MIKKLFCPYQWLALFCATMWAAGSIGVKSGLHSAPPLYFMGLRFTVAGSILAVYCCFAGSRWPRTRRDWGRHLFIGLLTNTLYMGLSAIALGSISAGLSSVAAGTNGLFLALGAALLFGERLTPRVLAGMSIALASLVAVMYSRLGSQNQPMGIAIIMLANLVMVASNLLFKASKNDADVSASQCIQLLGGGCLLLCIAAVAEDAATIRWDANLVASITFLIATCSLGAMLIFLHLLRRTTASVAGSYLFMVPILGLILGHIFADESLAVLDLVGGLGVAGGVYLVQMGHGNRGHQKLPLWARARYRRPLMGPSTQSLRLHVKRSHRLARKRSQNVLSSLS